MIIEARFQHFSIRSYNGKTYYNLDCYDDIAGCPLVMNVDNQKNIADILMQMKFGDPIACSVRLYEAQRGQYRLTCYDVSAN